MKKTSFNLDKETFEKFKILCANRRVKMSEQIELFMKDEVIKHGLKRPALKINYTYDKELENEYNNDN
jgi:hypothetical protein